MNRKQLLAAAVASILATGMVATNISSAFAMSDTPTAKAASKTQTTSDKTNPQSKKAEQDLVKVSQDALLSMRDLHNARWAIFNGNTDQAQTFVDAARTRIGIADKEAEKYALDVKAPKADDSYVPYDAEMTVMDDYQPQSSKINHIATVSKSKHQSENNKGDENLKLKETDVVLSTGMIPVDFAKEHINQASSLIKAGKYYQANLALKAVDDAVFVQTYALEDVPKLKGSHSKISTRKATETSKSENS